MTTDLKLGLFFLFGALIVYSIRRLTKKFPKSYTDIKGNIVFIAFLLLGIYLTAKELFKII